VYVPPSCVSVIVAELQGKGGCDADGERLALALALAARLADRLGERPRVGDVTPPCYICSRSRTKR
jgi:hypothetical protein